MKQDGTSNNNNQDEPARDEWLDKQEILFLMHISDRTLQRWRTDKLLPYTKVGGKIYYRWSDLMRLLSKR